MKTKIYSILFFALTLSSALTLSCCKNNDNHCPSTNQKVNLSRKDAFMPYQGNETLKFFHNNLDTQIFVGQGKETYYTTEYASQEGECAKDYENVRIKFLNQASNDILIIDYTRDANTFTYNQSSNPYTFYKVSYKNVLYKNVLYYSNSNFITINGFAYDYVFFTGNDTISNYTTLRISTGLLRLKIQNENWDLIL
jgi:hypothetical protein